MCTSERNIVANSNLNLTYASLLGMVTMERWGTDCGIPFDTKLYGPEEMWSGKPPSYKHLRVFDCDAYVHI
eukprot:c57164_g1_i1 orf=2-214(+)